VRYESAMSREILRVACLALSFFCACGKSTSAPDAGPDAGPQCAADAGPTCARPYFTKAPTGYVAGTPAPLLVMFHGYAASGPIEENFYLHFAALAEAKGFLYAFANGTPDSKGNLFWNATDACCNYENIAVDDVAYAKAIIDDMSAKYTVDPKRIFLFGHSNGGFLAHRIACEMAPRIAGIVSLAGAVWKDGSKCQPTAPIAILQLHGDRDSVILYDGGPPSPSTSPRYPSARETAALWAARNGCTGALQATGALHDLEGLIPGAETKVEAYAGCPAGAVELWTIQGGEHIPPLTTNWAEPVWSFLAAHPRP